MEFGGKRNGSPHYCPAQRKEGGLGGSGTGPPLLSGATQRGGFGGKRNGSPQLNVGQPRHRLDQLVPRAGLLEERDAIAVSDGAHAVLVGVGGMKRHPRQEMRVPVGERFHES